MPGLFTVAKCPVRHGQLLDARVNALACSRDLSDVPLPEAARRPWHAEIPQVFEHGLQQGFDVGSCRQISAQVIETVRLHLPDPHRFGPLAGLGDEGADDHADGEKRNEGDNVLRVGHGKGQVRRDEEKVKGEHPEESREDGRLLPETQCRHHDHQQIDHHHVGRLQGTGGPAY